MQTPPLESLTPREREILTLVAEGFTLGDIAHKLHRSLKTIETHRLSLGRKLNANNRVELARIAIASGLVKVQPGEKPDVEEGRVDPEQKLRWLSSISDAVSNVSGQRYLDALCNAMTRVLGVRFAAVCIPSSEPGIHDRVTVTASENGEKQATIQYTLKGTPAETAVQQGRCVVINDVQRAYPKDPVMAANGLESYLGIRLDGNRGIQNAVLAIVHDAPLGNEISIERVMRFFAPRTAAEIEVVRKRQLMGQMQRQLDEQSAKHPPGRGMDRLSLDLSHLTGARFFAQITNTLCDIFDARFAGVCVQDTVDGQAVYGTLCLSDRGRQTDHKRFASETSPCAQAMKDGFYCSMPDVAERYPDDLFLNQSQIKSYCGIRLEGQAGQSVGLLWVLDDKPFADARRVEHVLRFLGPRVGAEVESALRLEQLHESCERLELKVAEQQRMIHALQKLTSGAARTTPE